MNIKVSIIITIFNKLPYLKETITSALSQNFNSFEVIVIEDASTDGSTLALQEYQKNCKDSRISFHYMENNKGVVYCRNFGIKIARGRYLLPLDGDDLIEPDYLKLASEYLDNNKNCGIVYCKAYLIGNKSGIWQLPDFKEETIWLENSIFSSAMFRKKDAIKIGGYDSLFNKGHEDWDLWINILSLGRTVYRIDKVLFKYRITPKTRTYYADKVIEETTKNLFKKHFNYITKQPNSIEILSNLSNLISQKKQLTKEVKKTNRRFQKLKLITIILIISYLITGLAILY